MPAPARPMSAIRRLLTVLFVLDLLALIVPVVNLLGGGTDSQLSVGTFAAPLTFAGLRVQAVSGFVTGDPDVAQRLFAALSSSLTPLLLTLPMLVAARRVIDRAADTHPFTPETIRGLRRLGVLVMSLGAATDAIQLTADYLWYRSSIADTATFTWDPPLPTLWWLLVGLMLLAFAQIVEHGRKLRIELDEVI